MFKKDGYNALTLKVTQITLDKEDLIRKAEIICRFGHIYWRNPNRKTLFFVQYLSTICVQILKQNENLW